MFFSAMGFMVGINNPCDSSNFIVFHLAPFATKVNRFFNFFASSCFIMCYANGVVFGVVERMLLICLIITLSKEILYLKPDSLLTTRLEC